MRPDVCVHVISLICMRDLSHSRCESRIIWLKLVGTSNCSCLRISFAFDKFSQSYLVVTIFSNEIYEFIVTRSSRDQKFPEKEKNSARAVVSWYKCLSHPSITDSKEPQNALLLIVMQKQSFSREPILLYSTGLRKNSKEDSPPSTGLFGRPLT